MDYTQLAEMSDDELRETAQYYDALILLLRQRIREIKDEGESRAAKFAPEPAVASTPY